MEEYRAIKTSNKWIGFFNLKNEANIRLERKIQIQIFWCYEFLKLYFSESKVYNSYNIMVPKYPNFSS